MSCKKCHKRITSKLVTPKEAVKYCGCGDHPTIFKTEEIISKLKKIKNEYGTNKYLKQMEKEMKQINAFQT